MSLEEIRKFLRERGLEAVPSSGGGGGTTLADYLSWSPENTAAMTFLGGNFPGGITSINFDAATCDTLNVSNAFTNLLAVDLSTSAIANLTLPDTVQTLVLDGISSATFTCTFPAALTALSAASCAIIQLPALPAALQRLDVTSSPMAGGLPALPATLIELHCTDCGFNTLPALAGTQLVILEAANCGLTSLPALPATLTTLILTGTAIASVPTIPAACTTLQVSDCVWNSAKINNLLAQLVANGANNGTLDAIGTDGVPTGQGITDKNTLIARGWTVNTH